MQFFIGNIISYQRPSGSGHLNSLVCVSEVFYWIYTEEMLWLFPLMQLKSGDVRIIPPT